MFWKKKDKPAKKKGRSFFALDSHATMDIDLMSNWTVFKALCGFVFSSSKDPLLDIGSAKRVWGIEGWTDAETEKWRASRQMWGMIAMGFMLALMFLAGYNWWLGSFGIFSGIGYGFAFFAAASLATMYLWQADMVGGLDFVSYADYLTRFKWLFMAIAIIGWASMDQTALMAAQTVDMPDTKITKAGDLSAQFVGSIIGAPWGEYAQNGIVNYGMYSVLLPVLAALNTGALMFVSVFAVYIHTFSAVHVAHSGNWNDTPAFSFFWSPIRTVVALALCSPLTNGVSLLHHIILVAVAMSINLANNISDVFMDYLKNNNMQLSAVQKYDVKNDYNTLFNTMLVPVLRQVAQKNLLGGTTITKENGFRCSTSVTHIFDTDFWGNEVGKPMDNYALSCTIARAKEEGLETAIEIVTHSKNDNDIFQNALRMMYSDVYDMTEGYLPKNIEERQRNASELKNIMVSIFQNFKARVSSTSVVKVSGDVRASKDLLARMTELTAKYGWMTVGMYPFIIAKAQADLQERMEVAFTYQNIPDENFMKEWEKAAAVDYEKEKNQIREYLVEIDKATRILSKEPATQNVFVSVAMSERKNGFWNDLAERISSIGGVDPKSIANMFLTSNAIAALNQQGSNIIAVGATALSAFGLIKGITTDGNGNPTNFFNIFGKLGQTIGGVVGVWSPIVVFTCGLIMTFGFSCAYVLPALPIIFWARALVSWAIMLVQTMMGAPFWAAAHIFPEGAGLAGQHARQGYLMLLDVFIRPTLLVCGAIMCMLLLEAWTQILGQILLLWADLTIKAAGYSFLGVLITSGITMFVLYSTIKYLFVEALGGFPAQVMRWCGQHQPADGGHIDAQGSVSAFTQKAGQGLSGMSAGLRMREPSGNSGGKGSGGKAGARLSKAQASDDFSSIG